jgi:arylamine N-acetyltransferase
MLYSEISDQLFEKYLHLLGIQKRVPSYNALAELVAAQIMRVPFENISKLYYLNRYGKRDLPDLELYLNGIERYHFGGTCYSNNYYLHLLLSYLGYNVMLCGADMANPDVHLVNLVTLDNREFLVDAGYAAPFMKPLPRYSKQEFVISLGHDRYVLNPRDKNGNSLLELYRNNQLKHGYTVKPIPRQIGHFSQVIESSYRDSATFMNAILLARFYPNRSVVIHNLSIIESEGTNCHVSRLENREELPPVVEKRFSIPHEVVAEAISGLGELGDAWN